MAIHACWQRGLALGALVVLIGMPEMSFAGPQQAATLQSYIGNWRGSGLLEGGDEPEQFSCRIQVTDGTQGKINYQGRCGVAGINLAIYGTIDYNDDARRYEGVMNSNTEFKGLAIGRQRSSGIVFDFRGQEVRNGDELTINSKMTLKPESIVVEFNVWIADSEMKLSTLVPFERK